MTVIKKKNMDQVAANAAQRAPTLEDRIAHAAEMVHAHPAESPPSPTASQTQGSQSSQDAKVSTSVPANSQYATVTASGARLEVVPLELIDQNPFNARKIYSAERVKELAASIGVNGQDIPGVATRRNGRFVLAAGHYRLRALKLLAVKTMNLMVIDGLTDKELYTHSYRENAERAAQTSLDNALSWRELLDQGVYKSETEIADATGQSQPNVNKTLAALRLSPPVLELIKEDPKEFALTTLYELALYEAVAGQSSTLTIAKLVLQGDAGRKEIQEARQKLASPQQRKRKETSRQYKIQREGQLIGSLKEWDSGKVTFEVSLSDAKDRANLIAELRQRFGIGD